MKKRFVRFMAFVVALSALLSVNAAAYADKTYSPESGESSTYSTNSAKTLFKEASNYNKIEQPRSADYYSEYFTMYVNAEGGHSVYVYDAPVIKEINRTDTAFHGSRVYVVAERNGLQCVLYLTQKYEFKAAWISTDNLSSVYPGVTYSPERLKSKAGTTGTYYYGDPGMKLSKFHFSDTKTYYTELYNPVENCVEFILDYQVTARNGSKTEEVLGDVDIYVSDGGKWISIGTFDYDEIGPCHVRVMMDKPIDLYAFATVPHCASKTFVFRQSVIDLICEE